MNNFFRLIFLTTVLIALKTTCAGFSIEEQIVKKVEKIGGMVPYFDPYEGRFLNLSKRERCRAEWEESEEGRRWAKKRESLLDWADECNCGGLSVVIENLLNEEDVNEGCRGGQMGEYLHAIAQEKVLEAVRECKADENSNLASTIPFLRLYFKLQLL